MSLCHGHDAYRWLKSIMDHDGSESSYAEPLLASHQGMLMQYHDRRSKEFGPSLTVARHTSLVGDQHNRHK